MMVINVCLFPKAIQIKFKYVLEADKRPKFLTIEAEAKASLSLVSDSFFDGFYLISEKLLKNREIIIIMLLDRLRHPSKQCETPTDA